MSSNSEGGGKVSSETIVEGVGVEEYSVTLGDAEGGTTKSSSAGSLESATASMGQVLSRSHAACTIFI